MVSSDRRPRLLDLFCGAGGAGTGYDRAGFDVVGVDNRPQPRYPFEFHQADALAFPLEGFDAIHASPPCQFATALRALHPGREYENLIPATRDRLAAAGVPYVIENVEGAKAHLRSPVMLCGSAFALDLRRHRYFECKGFDLMSPGCAHGWQTPRFPAADRRMKGLQTVVAVYGGGRYAGDRWDRERAMGVDWMTREELAQAIPPAYTEHIGRYLLRALEARISV